MSVNPVVRWLADSLRRFDERVGPFDSKTWGIVAGFGLLAFAIALEEALR